MSERASVYVFNDSLIINEIVFGPQPSSHIYALTATAATMAKRNNFINEPTQDILFFSRLKNFGLDLNRMQIVHTFVLFIDSFEREFNNSKRTKMSRILIVQAKILPARAFIADRNNWYGAVREYAVCVWVCESVCVAFIWDACTTLDTKREIQFVCKCRYTMFDMHQIVEAKVERDTLRQREGAWECNIVIVSRMQMLLLSFFRLFCLSRAVQCCGALCMHSFACTLSKSQQHIVFTSKL